MSRSPTSNESRKTERGVGTSPLGRADATPGHITHVTGKGITPEKLRTAGPVQGENFFDSDRRSRRK
jgi:hypothetical protein